MEYAKNSQKPMFCYLPVFPTTLDIAENI